MKTFTVEITGFVTVYAENHAEAVKKVRSDIESGEISAVEFLLTASEDEERADDFDDAFLVAGK